MEEKVSKITYYGKFFFELRVFWYLFQEIQGKNFVPWNFLVFHSKWILEEHFLVIGLLTLVSRQFQEVASL